MSAPASGCWRRRTAGSCRCASSNTSCSKRPGDIACNWRRNSASRSAAPSSMYAEYGRRGGLRPRQAARPACSDSSGRARAGRVPFGGPRGGARGRPGRDRDDGTPDGHGWLELTMCHAQSGRGATGPLRRNVRASAIWQHQSTTSTPSIVATDRLRARRSPTASPASARRAAGLSADRHIQRILSLAATIVLARFLEISRGRATGDCRQRARCSGANRRARAPVR